MLPVSWVEKRNSAVFTTNHPHVSQLNPHKNNGFHFPEGNGKTRSAHDHGTGGWEQSWVCSAPVQCVWCLTH